MIADALADELRAELNPHERLIWTGGPRTGLRLERGDLFAVPFSRIWGGFAIFWMFGAVRNGAPLGFSLFGVPFVLVGLYMIAGRFFADAWRRSRTRYALTNERAIILSRFFGRKLVSIAVDDLGSVELTGGQQGFGTIRLTPDRMPMVGLMARSWPMGGGRGDAFEAIADAAGVLAHIRALRRADRRA